MENFDHLNGPIESVHDNEESPGIAHIRFKKQPEGFYRSDFATMYGTKEGPEIAYIERRLVDCWNALVDLPQVALDGGWTRSGLEAYGLKMQNQAIRAQAERDELAASLNSILERFRSGNDVPVTQATIRADAPDIVAAFELLAKLSK